MKLQNSPSPTHVGPVHKIDRHVIKPSKRVPKPKVFQSVDHLDQNKTQQVEEEELEVLEAPSSDYRSVHFIEVPVFKSRHLEKPLEKPLEKDQRPLEKSKQALKKGPAALEKDRMPLEKSKKALAKDPRIKKFGKKEKSKHTVGKTSDKGKHLMFVEQAFERNKKPLEKGLKALEKGKTLGKGKHLMLAEQTFERSHKPLKKGSKPLEKGSKPLEKGSKPLEKGPFKNGAE